LEAGDLWPQSFDALLLSPWVEVLMRITREELQRISAFVPAEWARGQERERELEMLLDRLYDRRELLWGLLAESLRYIRDRGKRRRESRECVISCRTEANALPRAV
jgi:hypothetical protein